MRTNKFRENKLLPEPMQTKFIIGMVNYAIFTFDKISIYSTAKTSDLHKTLPVSILKELNHRFLIKPEYDKGEFKSSISFVCPSTKFLILLHSCERYIQRYTISYLEIALDFQTGSEQEAIYFVNELVKHVKKPYSHENKIRFVYDDLENCDNCPNGIIPKVPTWYWESRGSTLNLKTYARYSKYNNNPVARLEYTIKRVSNIENKIKINTIYELLDFTPLDFLKKYYTYQEFQYEIFYAWLCGSKIADTYDKHYISTDRQKFRKQGKRYFMVRAHRDQDLNKLDDEDYPSDIMLTKWSNPNQIIGFLRQKRIEAKSKQESEMTLCDKKFAKLTDYQINKFFRKASAYSYVTEI